MTLTASKPRRVRVKSGCRTCKIRKVKCDEGRPACDRCLSTGRVCDGYGIWGGGGNGNGDGSPRRPEGPRPREAAGLLPNYRGLSPVVQISAAEQDCFAWFSRKAAAKLAGVFCIPFWSQLLPQACVNEPAIMHAALALSSTHQKNVLVVEPSSSQKDTTTTTTNVLDKSDEFTLVHYSKAIQQLQPHFAAGSSAASIRVALIACLVFACLEFINGRYTVGVAHLHSGLKLLGEFQGYSLDAGEPVLVLKPPRGFVDEWIADTLTKLVVQANLHGQGLPYPRLVMRITSAPLPSLAFHSVAEARQHLDQLVNDILYLAEDRSRLGGGACSTNDEKGKLARRQAQILAGLHTWRSTYKASRGLMTSSTVSPFTHYGYLLLGSLYSMAQIMAAACLVSDDDEAAETIYDAHTTRFLAIVRNSRELGRLGRYEAQYNPLAGYTSKMAQSTADMGWIPPLYYTALKCRVRRIRLHALRLLSFRLHKEGVWDSELTSVVAREAIRLEEEEEEGSDENLVEGNKNVSSSSSSSSSSDITDMAVVVEVPTEEEVLGLPTVPGARRLHDFHMKLPDDLAGKIVITYRQGPRSSGAPVCAREYDLVKRKWEDSWS